MPSLFPLSPQAVALLVAASVVVLARGDNNGLGRKPMMGWSTWCTDGPCFQDVCTEDETYSVVAAMNSSGLQAAGWEWISYDDCWSADTRDANGNLQADPVRFPSGMPAMVDFIHSQGFKVQIYTSLGFSTCSRSGRPLPLPGSYGHYEQDAAWFASIGADGIKGDWCNTSAGGVTLDVQNSTDAMAAAINATGHPMWFNFHCSFNGSSGFAPWCAADGNSGRVDHDHQDYWNKTGYGTLQIIGDNGQTGALAGAQPGGGTWWPDLDFLMTGGQGCPDNSTAHCPGQSDEEYKTEFTFWALTRSILLFATDPRNLTAVMREALFNSELLAVNGADCALPGATHVATAPCASTLDCEIWSTAPYCDAYLYVAVGNFGDLPATMALDFSVLPGLGASTRAVVRDLWAHQDLGTFTGSFPIDGEIAPHGTRAFQLRPIA